MPRKIALLKVNLVTVNLGIELKRLDAPPAVLAALREVVRWTHQELTPPKEAPHPRTA